MLKVFRAQFVNCFLYEAITIFNILTFSLNLFKNIIIFTHFSDEAERMRERRSNETETEYQQRVEGIPCAIREYTHFFIKFV